MRYEKGTIQISPARDIPLLQQVLRSGFATSDQLYEFMQLNQSERSRQAFDHRLRRLVAHGLIEKHQGAARGRPQVFVISKEGASLLIDVGELFAGRSRHNECESASDWPRSSWASCFEPP
jgi:DNA-binding HxlR family transcriptional regulator